MYNWKQDFLKDLPTKQFGRSYDNKLNNFVKSMGGGQQEKKIFENFMNQQADSVKRFKTYTPGKQATSDNAVDWETNRYPKILADQKKAHQIQNIKTQLANNSTGERKGTLGILDSTLGRLGNMATETLFGKGFNDSQNQYYRNLEQKKLANNPLDKLAMQNLQQNTRINRPAKNGLEKTFDVLGVGAGELAPYTIGGAYGVADGILTKTGLNAIKNPIAKDLVRGGMAGTLAGTEKALIRKSASSQDISAKDIGLEALFAGGGDAAFGALGRGVLKLLAKGKNVKEIAQELKVPEEQVQKILALPEPPKTSFDSLKPVQPQDVPLKFKKTYLGNIENMFKNLNNVGKIAKTSKQNVPKFERMDPRLKDGFPKTFDEAVSRLNQASKEWEKKTGEKISKSEYTKQYNSLKRLFSKPINTEGVATVKKMKMQSENISPMKGNGGALKQVNNVNDVPLPKKEEKIILSQDKKPLNLNRRLHQAYQGAFDSQHLIAGISNDVKVNASNARQTQGITDYIAEHGLVDKQGKKIGESLKDLAKNIPSNKEEDFWRYMAHQHNIARANEGKNVFSQFNAADSEKEAQALLAQHPEFKDAAKKVNGWINKFMDTWAKDLVGEDKLKLWRQMYPDYIPVYREMDPLKKVSFNGAKRGFVNQHNLVKQAKGAKADLSSNIKDPFGNIIQLVQKTVKAEKNNQVGKSILDEVRKGGLDDLFEVVQTKPSFVDDINKVLKDEGIEGVMDKFSGQQFDDVFKQAEKGNNIVKVMENGKEVLLKVKDLDYLKALQSLSDGTGKSAAEQFERAARRVARPIKELITGKNPLFAIFNIMRDTPNAFIQGSDKNPITFANRYMRALKEISHNSKGFQEFAAQGGMQSGFFKNDILKTTQKLKNGKNPLEKLISKVEVFNNLTEATPRYMEYLATLEKGGTKAQAIYNAAEVTTNFARSGKWGKFFDSFILYLNPALQGLDKFVRQVKDKPLQTILKAGGVVTIPQVATEYVNKDNPNYKSLDQRLKDDFFLIPNQFGPKDAQGYAETFFRIPKTREYSVVFAVLTNRIREIMNGKSVKDASKGVLGSFDRNFSVPTRPIWAPISDVRGNKDWKGAPINPLGMTLDNRSNYLKFDERTSEVGKVLSKMLDKQPIDGLKYSPKDIDYLLQSYTGIIGSILLPSTTKTESVAGIPKKKFIADSVYSNQSVSDFYDNLQKLRTRASDKNILGNIPGKKVTLEEKQRNNLDKLNKLISDLNKKAKQTTDEDKLRTLRKEIIQLAQKGNTMYNQYTK